MKRWGKHALLLLLGFALFLSGCNNQASEKKEKPPEEIHQVFLMYEEKYLDEYGVSVGDLYALENGEKDKIASNVYDGRFSYLNDQNKVFFLNDEYELYEYSLGKEKTKLADEVFQYNANHREGLVTYQNEDGDLYLISDKEEEKIASSVSQYEVIGNEVYYLDYDGDFSRYNFENNQVVDLAQDIYYFVLFDEGKEIAYVDDDSSLFYKKSDEDAVRVTGSEVSTYSIRKIDSNLVYFEVEDQVGDKLIVAPLGNNEKPQTVADDVFYYQYHNGSFYYVNDDSNLYRKNLGEDTATKIASDVTDLALQNGKLLFLDDDMNLFQLAEGDKTEKVGSSVSLYDVAPSGEVVYLTKDYDLFVNDKKIASEVHGFKHFHGNVAFAGDDEKLYLMEKMGEKAVVAENLDQYSTASYQNETLFFNEMNFKDIAGIWSTNEQGEKLFIEISEDGTMTNLISGGTNWLDLAYAGYNQLNATVQTDSVSFYRNADKTLTLTIGGYSYILEPAKQEQVAEYTENVQKERDAAEIERLLGSYLTNFPYAVNYGDKNYIVDYIAPDSKLYAQQVEFVANAYENNIVEELEDYRVENINKVSEGVYEVQCLEVFTIYKGDDAIGNTQTYRNTYTVERINGQFLLTGIKVNQEDSL